MSCCDKSDALELQAEEWRDAVEELSSQLAAAEAKLDDRAWPADYVPRVELIRARNEAFGLRRELAASQSKLQRAETAKTNLHTVADNALNYAERLSKQNADLLAQLQTITEGRDLYQEGLDSIITLSVAEQSALDSLARKAAGKYR